MILFLILGPWVTSVDYRMTLGIEVKRLKEKISLKPHEVQDCNCSNNCSIDGNILKYDVLM